MSILLIAILPLGGVILGLFIRWIYARNQLSSLENRTKVLKDSASLEAESQKKEILLKAQNSIIEDRKIFEKEMRLQKGETQRFEKRLQQKEDNLEVRKSELDKRHALLQTRQADIERVKNYLAEEEKRFQSELEKIAGLTTEEAKKILIANLENEARHDAQALLNKIEHEARASADKKAREILVTSMQRLATEVTAEITVTSVSLPNEEMKGRIIGREGRNIRTMETLTGVDVIIDDTPEAVVISCFDPIRKTIAKMALDRLISDGRIHPAKIEEVVQKVAKEINQVIYEEGEKVLFDLGVHDMRPEGINALGRLHYRTSFGQNVLAHTKEVAVLAGMIASELGADVEIAKRGALLHDVGKGIVTDSQNGHALLGSELARRIGEDNRVVNAVAAHHGDEEIASVEGTIVQLSDAISAARPGARRGSLESYIRRLENLEKIALSFEGVEKVFAIQAGREVRIMVNHEKVDDVQAKQLAREISKKIEAQLNFPGRIRVTIIREMRIVEYAN